MGALSDSLLLVEPFAPGRWVSLVVQMVKNSSVVQETRVQSLGQEDPLEMRMSPIFLPGEFYGQRSLVGSRPCGPLELDMTEQLKISVERLEDVLLAFPSNPVNKHLALASAQPR